MLDTEQNETQYDTPELKTELRTRDAERRAAALGGRIYKVIDRHSNTLVAVKFFRAQETPGVSMTPAMPRPIGDLDLPTLEEFEDLYAEERQMLAYRSLMGEALTPRERIRLSILNLSLDTLKPTREPLPKAVLDRVDEILRTPPTR